MTNDERTRAKDQGQRTKGQIPSPNSQLPTPNNQQPATSNQQPAASRQPLTTNRQSPVLRLLGLAAFGIGVVLFVTALRGPLALSSTRTPTPSSGDPQALAWLSESDAAMNELTSVKLLRTTRGDEEDGGVLTETMTFQAPDLFYSQVSSYHPTRGVNSSETVASGAMQYYRRAGERLWQAVKRAEPFRFPNFDLAQYATSATLGKVEAVSGQLAQVVSYTAHVDGRSFDFTRWIDLETKLILQEYMDAPGHHMLSVYEDYNAPVTITPPSPAEIGPTPTVVGR